MLSTPTTRILIGLTPDGVANLSKDLKNKPYIPGAVLAHPPARLTGAAATALDRVADIIAKAVCDFVPASALPPP